MNKKILNIYIYKEPKCGGKTRYWAGYASSLKLLMQQSESKQTHQSKFQIIVNFGVSFLLLFWLVPLVVWIKSWAQKNATDGN